MDWLWTWGGKSFGYRRGDSLYTHFGKEVGRFSGEDVFGSDGRYLGELRNNRLITDTSKSMPVHGSFAPRTVGSYASYANYAGYAMYAGYQDFPGPNSF
jgi:hypothetical protein